MKPAAPTLGSLLIAAVAPLGALTPRQAGADPPPPAAASAAQEEPAPEPESEPERPAWVAEPLPTVAERTAGLARHEGFVDLFHDGDQGTLLAVLPGGDAPFLYVVSLVRGLGSNDVGLDRGQLGTNRLLTTRRVGRRLQLVAPNLAWRVASEEPEVRRAAREAFAESVVAALPIVAEDADGRALVDLTDFVLRDAHRVAAKLDDAGQGTFTLDRERSAILPDGLRAFPDNVSIEVLETFAGDEPGRAVASTAADPRSVTLRLRHGFARLPADVMPVRRADPRSGYFTADWRLLDAAPDAPQLVQAAVRHRLPADGAPIVYYVDSGAPEPMRTALLEGARYWERAFADAGLPGRFRAELLPAGADVHDLRYNTVQWVHRSTRGWSYGNSIVDPRSGEILKGHVTLGALRVRQDVLLAEGLLAPYGDSDRDARVLAAALARLRQLAAHEIGHTLGLRHHFAASGAGRASVMDYPPPRVTLAEDGTLDLADAYRDGPGEWDALAIRYGYADFGADEEAGLAATLDALEERGLALLTDADASAGVHPRTHRWDDGADAAQALRHALDVRSAALANFDADVLRRGDALADLELALVPLFLHHRYALTAAATFLGGYEYAHRVKGDGAAPALEAVAPERQRAALDALLAALAPEALLLPAHVRAILPPPAPGRPRSAERFEPGAALVDSLEAAALAGDLVFVELLDPDRLGRLERQRLDDPAQLGARGVIDALVGWGWADASALPEEPWQRSAHLAARERLLERLLDVAADTRASGAVVEAVLASLRLQAMAGGRRQSFLPLALNEQLVLDRFFDEPTAERARRVPPRVPPGPPIGCGHAAGLAPLDGDAGAGAPR